MGVSILSGFVTTFGSGSVLLATEILFFRKFGMTICMTVAFSFVIATFTFGAFMHAIGPQKRDQPKNQVEIGNLVSPGLRKPSIRKVQLKNLNKGKPKKTPINFFVKGPSNESDGKTVDETTGLSIPKSISGITASG